MRLLPSGAASKFHQSVGGDLQERRPGNAFLSHLATEENVSASTQNQAPAALLFLYGRVLGSDAVNLEGMIRAQKRKYLPMVLTVEEVRAVLKHLDGTEALVGQPLDGSGLRLMEALPLRI